MKFGEVFKYDIVDSTNETAKELCENSHKRFVVTANEQKHGKGQYGRKWTSPSGENLIATFCIPQCEINVGTLVSFAAANAICKLLEKNNLSPKCKWPNDIEIAGNKLAGILIENVSKWVLIGIGLNVNWPSERSNLNNGKKCTGIFAETGKKFKVDSFITPLADLLYLHLNQSANDILKLYKQFWNRKNNIEVLIDDNKWISAKQTGIDSFGNLIVRTVSGNIIKINTSARVRTNVI